MSMIYPFTGKRWNTRSRVVASFIEPKSSVIDFGAGEENLRRFLAEPSAYYPVDKAKCTEHTIVADLNHLGTYPSLKADYVVAQGVLEYLRFPYAFLLKVHAYAPRLVISYRTEVGNPGEPRTNSYAMSQLQQLLKDAEWTIIGWQHITPWQAVFLCKA